MEDIKREGLRKDLIEKQPFKEEFKEEPAEEIKVETPKPEGIFVDSKKLDKMVGDFNEMALKVKSMEEQMHAGENLDKPKERGNNRVFLKIIRDVDNKPHIITSSKSSFNNRLVYSPTNANVVVGEILQAEYYSSIDDWSSGKVDQVYFTRSGELVYGEVIKKEGNVDHIKLDKLSDNAGEDTRELLRSIKEPVKVEISFVNP